MIQRQMLQGPILLQLGPQTTTRDAVVMPQKDWIETAGLRTGILLLTVFRIVSGSYLVLEGSNTSSGWFELYRATASTITSQPVKPIGLLSSYAQSDGTGYLWQQVRWAWRADSGSTLASKGVMFQIQGVLKS